ncbi:MAG TPA: hypothetical protein VG944_11395 [Fimbriimonas sp.]|nr:hypothetical protein [Fimbriimonas sp.]
MIPLLAALVFQQSGSWSFNYPDDSKPGSLIDLRYLNEKTAGETGYVRVSADGRGFVKGDGKPIRFWPVCSYGWRLKPEEMDANARFLAKMGVNMVRLHTSISPKGKGKTLTDYDPEEIDRIQRYVAACKKQGIYVTLSPYWANGGHSGAESSWGLGYGDGEDIWGLLIFDDRLKEAYKGWCRHLYLDKNPYTGIPLARDPTLAIAQVQNEDSLLFWTFQVIKAPEKKLLAVKFGKWLTAKYGSLDAAKSKWEGADQKGDDWGGGAPALLDTWVLTQPQTGGMKTRTDDQTAFLVDTQRSFYAEMNSFYKNELGYKGLTNASNWITADPVRQNDLERYTYLPTDVMAVNRYYNGGVHHGPNEGWRIDEGDFFTDISVLLDPRRLPINIKQVVGHPSIVTESGWVNPMGYKAEGPLLCAAYECLTGVAGLYWFELDGKNYDANPVFDFVTTPDGNHPLSKWEDSIPATLGQFPAAALLYRMGYVRQGTPVIHEERTREQLNQREVPVISEDPSFDPNHNGRDARAATSQAKGADPLAYLVGPVDVKYDGDPSKTSVKDLASYIDRRADTVNSDTGELSWDYGKGLVRLNAPRAQGVVGFLAKSGGTFSLKDITVLSQNDYAAITVVPLDDKPIASSHKLLVQVGTVARPTGWAQEPATGKGEDDKGTMQGWKVVNTGKMPWQIRDAEVEVSVRNLSLTKATLLDPAGYPAGAVPVTKSKQGLSVRLPPNTMYLVLE